MRAIRTKLRWGLIGSVLFVGAAREDVVPPPGAEVVNGGFEDTTPAPWEIYGPIAEVTSDAPGAGAKSLRLGITGTGDKEAGAYQDVTGTGAGPARVSASIAVDQALTGDTQVELFLEVYSKSTGEPFDDIAEVIALTAPQAVGAYTTYSACVDIARIDDVILRPVVLVRSSGGAGAGAVRIDDVDIDLGADSKCQTATASDDGGCQAGGALGALAFAGALTLIVTRRRRARTI